MMGKLVIWISWVNNLDRVFVTSKKSALAAVAFSSITQDRVAKRAVIPQPDEFSSKTDVPYEYDTQGIQFVRRDSELGTTEPVA